MKEQNIINNTKKGVFIKYSLLAASAIVATAPAINGNIPAMASAFPDVPLSMVELLATIPSLFLIISTLLSGFIAKKIGYKPAILIGIGITAVCGVLPVLTDNFYLILASRALFGFGTGLFYSLLVVLISYFYDGQKRTKLLGYQATFEGIGGILVTFISGQLLIISWQASFLAYAIIIPIFILFALFVPNVQAKQIADKNNRVVAGNELKENKPAMSFKRSAWIVTGYTTFLFIIACLFMIMGIKVTTLMVDEGYGVGSDGSTIIIMVCIGTMIGGAVFGYIVKYVKKYTAILGVLILAAAMFMIGESNTVFFTGVAGILVGLSIKIIMPYLLDNLNNGTIRNSVLATSILIAGYNLGTTLSPYGSILIEKLPWVDSLRGVFYANGIILIIIAILFFGVIIAKRPKKEVAM